MTLDADRQQLILLFARLAVLFGTILGAHPLHAEERGTGSLQNCVALETCFQDGTCSAIPYKATYLLMRYFDPQRPGYNRVDFFVNGPTRGDAGGGTFFPQSIEVTETVSASTEILDRGYGEALNRGWIAAIPRDHIFAGQGRLFYLRPMHEVKPGGRGHAVTEFRCGQVLF